MAKGERRRARRRWERFGRLPLAADEKGKIYAKIHDMPLSRLRSLIPSFLDDAAVAASLREEFLKKRKAVPMMKFNPDAQSSMRQRVEELKTTNYVSISLGKGKFVDWIHGSDSDPKNCDLPKERWESAVALKEALHRAGYRRGAPLRGPKYDITIYDFDRRCYVDAEGKPLEGGVEPLENVYEG
ncbi:uncharacterized protein LOC9648314 [Selaginella moellendorffii]|uniref:uncharacterized protein LOC9648314 n=1 Tax=Selaginella moellendorffii TaxID=88036 RepID=UPI000D1C2D53|nr:uncharacterized protein LOC9648314 [Selaginella moellendorffii]|eukprot:XP_024542432.1 uncharacterized protein LOC9648314 [Selaginella moellendorffii]